MNAREWSAKLELLPHPEGGFYKEVYRSRESYSADGLPQRFEGGRAFATAIYYLLQAGDFSAFHRIKSDEIWHHYDGGDLELCMIDQSGALSRHRLGHRHADALPMLVVPHGCWFAARPASGTDYVLCGCTVAPGFDFSDFEMATRDGLLQHYPQHAESIEQLTRPEA